MRDALVTASDEQAVLALGPQLTQSSKLEPPKAKGLFEVIWST
jgi:hypothetical protein